MVRWVPDLSLSHLILEYGLTRQHSVMFYSPGTLFNEQRAMPIASWDHKLAVSMAETVIERHGARPYCFKFFTHLVAVPVPDGEGGTLHVESKEVDQSGRYFLGGKILTVQDVESRADPRDEILISNMKINGFVVVENTNSYRSTHEFGESDCIVNAIGHITARGDDKKWIEARAALHKAIG